MKQPLSKPDLNSLYVLASPAFKSRRVNPYTWELYSHLECLGVYVGECSTSPLFFKNPNIWHIHWKEELLKYSSTAKVIYKFFNFVLQLMIAKKKGIKIVWTVHNLGPHDRRHPWLEKLFWRLYIPSLDGCIHLSEIGHQLALERFPNLASIPSVIIPHQHYRNVYPDSINKQIARRQLNLGQDDKVVLFLGQIRAYKNVPQLIYAFREIAEPEARLVIAGWPREDGLDKKIESTASVDSRILTNLEFIPGEKLQTYLRAADLMVTPYEDILNSGSALLALSFDCPVLAPAKGALTELQSNVGENWVYLYKGNLNAGILETTLNSAIEKRQERPDLSKFDKEHIANATLEAYIQFLNAT